MNIDRGTFLLLVGTLAAGGAAGYMASEKHVFPALDDARGNRPSGAPTTAPTTAASTAASPSSSTAASTATADASSVTAAPAVASTTPAPSAPSCDDSVATVGACPGPGLPTVEGGCGSFASVRCAEMKLAMKPKVASAAVACLAKLSPQERCDPSRVTLCGHLALMNACPERELGAGANANANANATANVNADAGAGARSVEAGCQAIMEGCAASPIAPSMVECRQLLSGMTEAGREKTRACMKTHCFDRGLVGCEGIAVK